MANGPLHCIVIRDELDILYLHGFVQAHVSTHVWKSTLRYLSKKKTSIEVLEVVRQADPIELVQTSCTYMRRKRKYFENAHQHVFIAHCANAEPAPHALLLACVDTASLALSEFTVWRPSPVTPSVAVDISHMAFRSPDQLDSSFIIARYHRRLRRGSLLPPDALGPLPFPETGLGFIERAIRPDNGRTYPTPRTRVGVPSSPTDQHPGTLGLPRSAVNGRQHDTPCRNPRP
jgi:hypothetical protein